MSTQMDLLGKIGSIGGCKLALLLTLVVLSSPFGFTQRVSWLNIPADYINGDYFISTAVSNDGKTVLLSVREGADNEGEYDWSDYWFEVYRVNQGLVYRSPRGFVTGNTLYSTEPDANGMSHDGNYVVGRYFPFHSSFEPRAFVFSLQQQQFIDLTEWVAQFISGWWQEEGHYLNLLSADVVSLNGRYILGRFAAYNQHDHNFTGIYWLSPYGIRLLRDPEDSQWNPSSLSPDGNICIVDTTWRCFRWVPLYNSLTHLEIPQLPGFLSRTISWYGRTVAGTSLGSQFRSFRWDAADSLGAFGRVSIISDIGAYPNTVSASGRVIVGSSYAGPQTYRWVRYTKEDLPSIDVQEDLHLTYRGVLSQYSQGSRLSSTASVGLLNQDSRDTRDAQHIIGVGINPTTQQPDLFVLDTCSNPPQLSEFLKTLMLPFASMDGQRVGWKPSTYDQHGKRCADDKGLYAVDFNLPGGPRQDCGMIVVAAHSGYVYYQVLPGYGNLAVVIAEDVSQHSGVHVATLYAHLREKNPSLHGKWVCAGTPIGTVGSTGRGTGPHLHFQICYVRRSSTVVYEAKDVGYNGKIQIVNNPSVLLSGQPVVIPPVRRSQLEPNPQCPNLPRYSYHGSLLYTTAPEIPAPYIDLYGCQRGDAQWSHDPTCCEGNFGDDGDEDLGSHGDWSVDDADVYILLTDLDANGCVDDSDLLSLLFEFGSEGAVTGDINWDLIVDADDLVLLLQDFGLGCE